MKTKKLALNYEFKSDTFSMFFQKFPENGDLDLSWSGLQVLQILKPIRLLLCKDSFCIHIDIPELYTILLSRDSKHENVGHHPPSTTKIKNKSSGWRVRS